MYKTGSATDHIDLLEQLIDFATGRGVESVAIDDGGTGYDAGDILTAAGGTFSFAATFEVEEVDGGGVITAIRVVESGTYTVDPTNPDSPTGGAGTGASLNYTMADAGWTLMRESFYATGVTLAAGGVGYQIGNLLTVVGGTFVQPVVVQVTGVSSTVVTSVALTSQIGEYTVAPSNPASTSGGTGSGCTVNLTFTDDRWAILQGEGAGSDEIVVGIRTYTAGSAHNWEVAGMAGYNAVATYQTQPDISPGRYEAPAHGHYVPLNNASLDYWFFVSTRRIVAVAKVSSAYSSCYLGWIDPFGTTTEYPYPLAVGSSSSLYDRLFSSTSQSFSGIMDPVGHQSSVTAGPISIRDPGGTWTQFMNSKLSGGSRTEVKDAVVYPAGHPNQASVADIDKAGVGDWEPTDFIPTEGIPGTPTVAILQTQDSPDFSTYLWPALLIEATPIRQVLGEFAGVFWLSTIGETTDIVAEDLIDFGGMNVFVVFHQGNRTERFNHFCVRRG